MRFNTQGAANSAWLGGDATATAVFNALSLTFPIGERLFIDSVRNYRDQLSGALLAETKAFIAQLPTPPAGGFSPGGHDSAYWSSQLPAEIGWLAPLLTA